MCSVLICPRTSLQGKGRGIIKFRALVCSKIWVYNETSICTDMDVERALRDAFDKDIAGNKLSIPGAVKAMRRISRLTQAEFAKHRGISLVTLKEIESTYGFHCPRIHSSPITKWSYAKVLC